MQIAQQDKPAAQAVIVNRKHVQKNQIAPANRIVSPDIARRVLQENILMEASACRVSAAHRIPHRVLAVSPA
jgi:hypothetical protein